MYKISVPVMSSNLKRAGIEKTVEELKKLNAERVFLALDSYISDAEKRKAFMSELKENCSILKNRGFEVGAWICPFDISDCRGFKNMRTIKGSELKRNACPTDENFVEFVCGYIKDIAATGVDIIMFDDDFRYGFLGDSPACLCDNHIAKINNITGENSTMEELYNCITFGKKNKYRDAFLKANGDVFKNFARKVRNALDEIRPNVRLGYCACMSSWDLDGTTASELAYILAGNTKPFVRLIGAPYWAVNKSWGNCLQDVIELERMESSWTKDGNIEIMAEGDAYPRPRTNCPANFLEGFDTALRAAGCTDGILKYGIDYISNADYETGYAEHHIHNRNLYNNIDRIFSSKASVGVRIYTSMNKISDLCVPTTVNPKTDIENLFFCDSARTMSYNTIPTVYEGDGICGVVFGENARNLPLECMKKGLILDIAAAEILTERGVDVGITEISALKSDAEQGFFTEEHFIYNNNRISALNSEIYDIKLCSYAEVLSDAEIKSESRKIPVSYRYINNNGNRFLVLNINARKGRANLLYHYERSRQFAENIPWLSGKKLPAYVYSNPSLYIQCKKSDTALSVGLWNFFPDNVFNPVVHLDKVYTDIEFVNCNGYLEKDKVYLSNIAPYGIAAFEVK